VNLLVEDNLQEEMQAHQKKRVNVGSLVNPNGCYKHFGVNMRPASHHNCMGWSHVRPALMETVVKMGPRNHIIFFLSTYLTALSAKFHPSF
jgi:hypothetical protein